MKRENVYKKMDIKLGTLKWRGYKLFHCWLEVWDSKNKKLLLDITMRNLERKTGVPTRLSDYGYERDGVTISGERKDWKLSNLEKVDYESQYKYVIEQVKKAVRWL